MGVRREKERTPKNSRISKKIRRHKYQGGIVSMIGSGQAGALDKCGIIDMVAEVRHLQSIETIKSFAKMLRESVESKR